MKYFGLIVIFCVCLALSACGDSDSSAKAPGDGGESGVIKPFEPEIDPPKTLPKKLVINDIKEGTGPAAKPGDELLVNYFSVDQNDKERFRSSQGGFEFELGTGSYWPGWEKGMEGMKAGGRREILIPRTMTKNLGYLFYIVDLIEIKEPKAPPEEESESTEGSAP